MTWTRTPLYTISGDFGGKYIPSNFKTEILASAITTSIIIDTGNEEDNIKIIFDIEPTTEEKTILDGLVSLHNSVKKIIYSGMINNILNVQIKDSSYKRICTFIYQGPNSIGAISKIVMISNKSNAITNYTVLIEDITNNLTIAENTFSNDLEEIKEFTPINNIPTDQSIIEIFVKKSGGSGNTYVDIESITFYLL